MTENNCENCKFYDEDIDTQPCCTCRKNENFEADRNVGCTTDKGGVNV